MKSPLRLASVVLAALFAACASADSIVYVDVTADPSLTAVARLEVDVSGDGATDTASFPKGATGAPLSFPTAFTLQIPRRRHGEVHLTVHTVTSSGTRSGRGETTAVLRPGERVNAQVALAPVAPTCGGQAGPCPPPSDASAPPGGPAPDAGADQAPRTDGPGAAADSARAPDSTLAVDAPISVDAPVPPTNRRNGDPCKAASECESTQCADGVCCATECKAACYSCNLDGSRGSCRPVPAKGEDPRRTCTPEPPESCGRDGTCDGNGGCRKYDAGLVCAQPSCSGGVEYAARTCNGQGVCSPPLSRPCQPFTCKDTACATTCADANDCMSGATCTNGTCSKLPLGVPCSNAQQCESGFCTDGYCCIVEDCKKLVNGCGTCAPGIINKPGRCESYRCSTCICEMFMPCHC